MENALRGVAARHQKLALVQACEQRLGRLGARELGREVGGDIGQEAQLEHRFLFLAGQRVEQLLGEGGKHVAVRRAPAPRDRPGDATLRGTIGQKHQARRPALRSRNVDGSGPPAHAAGHQRSRLALRELQRRLIQQREVALERELGQFVGRQRATQANALQPLRQLAQHDAEHRTEVCTFRVVQVVDDEQARAGEAREVGAEETAREFRRLVGVFGSEHRQVAHGCSGQRAADVVKEAGDVLVAFVDAIPDVRCRLLLQVVEHRGGLAVAGRRRDPAGAAIQQIPSRNARSIAATTRARRTAHGARCASCAALPASEWLGGSRISPTTTADPSGGPADPNRARAEKQAQRSGARRRECPHAQYRHQLAAHVLGA